jgi:hypothetical protein
MMAYGEIETEDGRQWTDYGAPSLTKGFEHCPKDYEVTKYFGQGSHTMRFEFRKIALCTWWTG